MNRPKRTDDELRKAAEHLEYEIGMLVSMANILSINVLGRGQLANAALESFTIHARNLLDFLYPQGAREDDVIADDYFPIPDDWQKRRTVKTQILENVHRRVGKEVAHLTYARLEINNEQKQ